MDPQGGQKICLTWRMSEIFEVLIRVVTSNGDKKSVQLSECQSYPGSEVTILYDISVYEIIILGLIS